MSLFGAPEEPDAPANVNTQPAPDPACRFGLAVTAAHAIEVTLDTPGLKEALTEPHAPQARA